MYDPSQLAAADATSADWALAWARRLADDTGEPERSSDGEWLAELSADALTVSETVYYRPHRTAARLIARENGRVKSESVLGGSVAYRSPQAQAAALLGAYAWMDALIPEADRPGPPYLVPRF